jgi:hypothetical protein
MSVISAQWALNETTGGVMSISKGVLVAATSDNIQVLSIVTAESFGATIAMSQEAIMKVEQEVNKNHKSHIVSFLKSYIGYSKNDSAVQLARTDAGLRFLGLASALICTSDLWESAQALDLMIRASATKNQYFPSTRQLKELLLALEYKLCRVGFADSVTEWEIFFLKIIADEAPELSHFAQMANESPPKEGLQALLNALSTLARIGDTAKVKVKAGGYYPWVVAFIKWCIGKPPTVILENGKELIKQPMSNVEVLVSFNFMAIFEVKVFKDILEPRVLWTGCVGATKGWNGFISVSIFGERLLQKLGIDTPNGRHAIIEALSYSLKFVTSRLYIANLNTQFSARSFDRKDDRLLENMTYRGSIFPTERHIAMTLSLLLSPGESYGYALYSTRDGESIFKVPLVQDYTNYLKSKCDCLICTPNQLTIYSECLVDGFKSAICGFTFTVLSFSLFDTIADGHIRIDTHMYSETIWRSNPSNQGLHQAVKEILLFGAYRGSDFAMIMEDALSFLGHRFRQDVPTGEWIARAKCGQVVFPRFFDNGVLDGQGLLRLGVYSGQLVHDDISYQEVNGYGNVPRSRQKIFEQEVNKPCNLMPEEKIIWQITKGENILHLGCTMSSSTNILNPWKILQAATESFYIPECGHPRDKPLQERDMTTKYIGPPVNPKKPRLISEQDNLYPGEIGIVPADGNDGLRLLSLGYGAPCVVRCGACLQCCIDICRKVGLNYVVC